MTNPQVKADLQARQRELNDQLSELTAKKGDITLRIASGETAAIGEAAATDAAIAQVKVELEAISPALSVVEHRLEIARVKELIDGAERQFDGIRDAVDAVPAAFERLAAATKEFGAAYCAYIAVEETASDTYNASQRRGGLVAPMDRQIDAKRLVEGLMWLAGARDLTAENSSVILDDSGKHSESAAAVALASLCKRLVHRARVQTDDRKEVFERELERLERKNPISAV